MSKRILSILKHYDKYREVPEQVVGNSVIFDFDDPAYNECLELERSVKSLLIEGRITEKDLELLNSFTKTGTFSGTAIELSINRRTVKNRLIKLSDLIAEKMGKEYSDEYLSKLLKRRKYENH